MLAVWSIDRTEGHTGAQEQSVGHSLVHLSFFGLECQPFLGSVPTPDGETAGSLKGIVLGITDPGLLSSLRISFQNEADWYLCARERLGVVRKPCYPEC